MRIGIANIGPIESADFSINKLTLLVGPNGSGKTTLSSVAYAATLANADVRRQIASLAAAAHAAARRAPRSAPSVFSKHFVPEWEAAFREAFEHHLRRCVMRSPEELTRVVSNGNARRPIGRIVLSNRSPLLNGWRLVFRIRRDQLILDRSHASYHAPELPAFEPSESTTALRDRLRRRLSTGVPYDAVYLPAARSGFMQMRDALDTLIFGALSAGYYDSITVGAVPGAAADLMALLARLSPEQRTGVAGASLNELQHDILGGRVALRRTATGAHRIVFIPRDTKQPIPIEAAATSVSELAPLILYLRHLVQRSHMLLMDEPEAHLHPESQVRLAQVLYGLSRSLTALVLATHSEFLVSALSNAMLLAHQDEDGRPRTPRIYAFDLPGSRGRGSVVRRLQYDARSGFDIEQFSTVADEAFEESIALYNRLHSRAPSTR